MGNFNSDFVKLKNYDPNDYKNDTELDLNSAHYANFGNYTFERMALKDLIELPLQDQMRFSDAICRRYALNPLFKNQQYEFWKMYKSTITVTQLNETSIGNAAAMKYYNPDNLDFIQMYDDTINIVRNGRL